MQLGLLAERTTTLITWTILQTQMVGSVRTVILSLRYQVAMKAWESTLDERIEEGQHFCFFGFLAARRQPHGTEHEDEQECVRFCLAHGSGKLKSYPGTVIGGERGVKPAAFAAPYAYALLLVFNGLYGRFASITFCVKFPNLLVTQTHEPWSSSSVSEYTPSGSQSTVPGP